jgi:hypothetical protein
MKNGFFVGLSLGVCLFLVNGCGQGDRPFQYQYLAKDTVVITYQGKDYTLVQSENVAGLPFTYEFEDDGDLDLAIEGRSYEIESPYDRDTVKKKTVKKKIKKSKKKR